MLRRLSSGYFLVFQIFNLHSKTADLILCSTVSTQGVVRGGGVGDLMGDVVASKSGHDNGRLAFDFLYWVLVNVITLNLVLGVIVDVSSL